jgi:hypothetical protein
VLHVGVGDCVAVTLTNRTSEGAVTYHCDLLSADPATSGGVAAGYESPPTVGPGQSTTFTYYASPEVGETVALVRDWGNVLVNPGLGLYGAIVVGPAGATYKGSGWSVDVHPRQGRPYRDVSLFFQDADEGIGNHRMPYDRKVRGVVGVNYQAAPLSDRLTAPAGTGAVYRSDVHGDPPTPLIQAYAGDPVRVHVVAPWSEQGQVFSIEGHQWRQERGTRGSNVLSSVQVGGLEAVSLDLVGGAGGRDALPGDYVYGDHRGPYLEAGLWGILRVHPTGAHVKGLHHLSGGGRGRSRELAGLVAVVLVGAALVVTRRARRSLGA